ncbi:MAG TPA: c-type cytochrome [Burkholderiaceae bacterium]|nr:c-type cytochrome [Burkholderiaceae bacterium]
MIGGFIHVPTALADAELTETWTIAEGGKLYDSWFKALYYDPKNLPTHASYPPSSRQKGEGTWRCKECHGWDYKGKDGAYAKGSRFTGIKGIRAAAGMAPERVASIIRDRTHGYTEAMIPNRAVAALALFVSRGQIEVDPYIDRETKKANGDPKRGARFYQSICAVCHGFDGKQINFQKPEDPEYVGTVATDNPWETLHKIRSGQPGVPMPSLGVLELKDQVDILAYCQTLPVK